MKRFTVPLLTIVLVSNLFGQEVLTFESALQKTLDNNYNILISKNDQEIAKNNAERKANGYLPNLTGSGGYNWTYYTGSNNTLNGERDFDPNNSYNYNAGLTLSYSIFNGLGRKYNFELANGNRELSSLGLRVITENTILQLSRTFHEVARLQEQKTSLDSTLAISKQRLLRARYGYEYGQSTQLDILNAQVDMDTDSINLLNSRQQLENTKRNLNLIMGTPIDQQFEIQEAVVLRNDINAEQAIDAALASGSRALTADQQKSNAKAALGASRSSWYPNLGLTAGYQYRGSEDPNGAFLLSSNSYGPTAGLNLNWNIFDGSNSNRIQNAEIQLESGDLAVQQTREQVRLDALNAHGTYQNSLFVLEAREGSVGTAQRNFDRSEESFKLGQISSVEFRQAQLNLLNSQLMLSQALYDAKNNELLLLSLMGQLID